MSVIKQALKKLGIEREDLSRWMRQAEKDGRHARLLAAYDKSLAQVRMAEEGFEYWMQCNVDKDDETFDRGYERCGKRVQCAQQVELARLGRLLKAYKRDRAAGR